MQREYFYLGIQLFFTFVNLYFMQQSRESNLKLSNFCAFAAGFTYMGSLYSLMELIWG